MKKGTTMHFLLILAALLTLALAAQVKATTLLRLNIDQMAQAADVVARVKCTETSSQWEGGSIWTRSTFSLIDAWKGSPAPSLTVRLPGGRAGHFVSEIEAVPQFRPGEDGVLFLQSTPNHEYAVIGWAQGTFRIRRNERTGESSVTQDSSAVAVFDPVSRRFVRDGVRDLPLGEFERRLAGAFGSRGGTRRGDAR